ncbi:MAG: PaaI family thioesterase [Sporosarcina sp.]
MTVGEIKKEFVESPYLQHLGIEILSIEKENTRIKLNVQDYLLNTKGTLHGGVTASMLDFVQKMHLRSVCNTRCVPISSTVHFTAPVKTGAIYAEASIISSSYKTAFLEGIITSESGDIISKGTGTFKLIRDE